MDARGDCEARRKRTDSRIPFTGRDVRAERDASRSSEIPLLSIGAVRKRRKGFTRITSKSQATIPVQALEDAGLKPGDEVRVVAAGRGRILLERDADLVERHAGRLPGVYESEELDALRDEWR